MCRICTLKNTKKNTDKRKFLKDWNKLRCALIGRLNIVKMSVKPILMCKFNAI